MRIESASICVLSSFVLARQIELSTRLTYRKCSCQTNPPVFQHKRQVNDAKLGAYVIRGLYYYVQMLLFNPTSITSAFGRCLIRRSETALLSAFHSSLPPVPDHQRYACQRYSTDPVHPELARHGPARTTLFRSVVEETHAEDRLPSVSQVLCNSGDYVLIGRLGARKPWSLLQSSS